MSLLTSEEAVKRKRYIRAAMALHGLSYIDIAERLGVSIVSVLQILTLQRPGFRHRGKIARMLGIPKEELFPGRQVPLKPGRKPRRARVGHPPGGKTA